MADDSELFVSMTCAGAVVNFVEGTIAHEVSAFGLFYAHYRGLAKTRLQHIPTTAAINLDRLVA